MPKTADHRTHLVLENYIGGKFVPFSRHIDSYDPSTGEVYCKVPDSGKEEVELAVTAAKEAFPAWAARSPSDRAQVLHKLADLIEAHLEEFAQAESRDQGKTITFARTVDIPRAAYNFRFFATSVLHHTTECSQQDHLSCITYTIRSPVGVAGLISPWNLPLYLLTWKIAPAIAVGNTVVAKPSEMTSVTAWMMCKLLEEAGVPPGVVNIVFGTGPRAGDALVSHPEVPVISFTGSTATAQIITERSAPFCKRLSFELGGKNPAVIFRDADLEECIQTTVRSSFSNQGEICLCTSRIFVERSLYPEFLKRFVAAAQLWKTGAPCDSGNNNGALISREHLDKEMLFALLGPNVLWQGSRPPVLDSYCPEDFLSYLASGEPHWFSGEYQEQVWLIRSQVRGYVKLAVSEGAQVHCGEGVDTLELPDRHRGGYFMAPTVLTGVEDTSRCMQEEIFGPVTCITPFDSEEEVIGRANGVRYGLAAVVWSRDVSRVHRVTRRLQAGLVWSNCWLVRDLNMPFGGMKCSGVGREGGRDSYHFFTEVKTITVKH